MCVPCFPMCVACCAIASVGVGFSGHSNAGILAAVSLGLAALAWPSLLCLPYLLLLAGAVLAWSASASSPAGSRSMRVVQVYAGLPLNAASFFFFFLLLLLSLDAAVLCTMLHDAPYGAPCMHCLPCLDALPFSCYALPFALTALPRCPALLGLAPCAM